MGRCRYGIVDSVENVEGKPCFVVSINIIGYGILKFDVSNEMANNYQKGDLVECYSDTRGWSVCRTMTADLRKALASGMDSKYLYKLRTDYQLIQETVKAILALGMNSMDLNKLQTDYKQTSQQQSQVDYDTMKKIIGVVVKIGEQLMLD